MVDGFVGSSTCLFRRTYYNETRKFEVQAMNTIILVRIISWVVFVIFLIWFYMMAYWLQSLYIMNKEVPKTNEN